eukprot:Tamp_09838.p1 GENE.Tamp_09838~~Tamp_09838.p1  ORF type:complete len:191 (+),score=15.32 Tamp_09838:1537-2109(+)
MQAHRLSMQTPAGLEEQACATAHTAAPELLQWYSMLCYVKVSCHTGGSCGATCGADRLQWGGDGAAQARHAACAHRQGLPPPLMSRSMRFTSRLLPVRYLPTMEARATGALSVCRNSFASSVRRNDECSPSPSRAIKGMPCPDLNSSSSRQSDMAAADHCSLRVSAPPRVAALVPAPTTASPRYTADHAR